MHPPEIIRPFVTRVIALVTLATLVMAGCTTTPSPEPHHSPSVKGRPRIASWLAKKEELIASGRPYSLVMSGWFTPDEARLLKDNNPEVRLLAGLSVAWVYDDPEWMKLLTTVASHGKGEVLQVTDDMYLARPNGDRCAFGWKCAQFGTAEIYAMDPRNEHWAELITSYYKAVLSQAQHDGVIVDMVTERQWWCPDIISDEEWLLGQMAIMAAIRRQAGGRLVILNAGRSVDDIAAYLQYCDGFLLENFLGQQMNSTFEDGLAAAETGLIVIYGVDTDDTGLLDMNRMRLGLALSLLNDNTYFTCDFGPRDHGQAWWFPEYDTDLGKPLGKYFLRQGAYWREFELGMVVCAPHAAAHVSFAVPMMDVTTGIVSASFTVLEGDARLFVIPDQD